MTDTFKLQDNKCIMRYNIKRKHYDNPVEQQISITSSVTGGIPEPVVLRVYRLPIVQLSSTSILPNCHIHKYYEQY